MFAPDTKVLLVDDTGVMRKMIKKMLGEIGFTTVEEADDGTTAWDKLEAAGGGIQLVISDWNMPQLEGIELLKKCRGSSNYAKVPFLLVTAEAEEARIQEATAAGASGYLKKPFKVDALKAKLEEVHAKL